ncbi:MAG: hypothetical protein JO131_05070 [Gammaproteobacteria bacterium]|nr:hypothetical protein [Gammaproteobacteria bacterium]
MKSLRSCILITALISSNSFSLPTQIIIFPHAEKAINSPHLSAKGIADAQILQNFIMNSPQLKPNIVIANRTPNQRALGSIETCQPIAKKLDLSLQTDFLESEYKKMIEMLLTNPSYTNKKVLICWDKHDMASIASSIKKYNVTETTLNPKGYEAGNLFVFKN